MVREDNGLSSSRLLHSRVHPPTEDALVVEEVFQLVHIESVSRLLEWKLQDSCTIKLDVIDWCLKEKVFALGAKERILAEAEPATVVVRHDDAFRVNNEWRD
jgi:hypothetical protein